MNSVTLEILTKKLQTASPSILDRVLEYTDALLDSEEKVDFVLSEDQKKTLLEQNNVALENCTEAHLVYQNLKNKYGL